MVTRERIEYFIHGTGLKIIEFSNDTIIFGYKRRYYCLRFHKRLGAVRIEDVIRMLFKAVLSNNFVTIEQVFTEKQLNRFAKPALKKFEKGKRRNTTS